MRLGLVIYGSLDTRSGGYLYDRMLVRELRAQGHTVLLYSLPWRSYPAHLADNLRLGLAARLANAQLDILLQDELNHPSLFLLNRRLRHRVGCPILTIVHHLRSQEHHPRSLLPLYRLVERAYLQSVAGCIYNSHTTCRSVSALAQRHLPGPVVYPAADHITPPTRADVLSLLQSRGSSYAPLQVLFVGNVIARKGLHDLVEALAMLPANLWHLHIVGSQDTAPTYVRQVRMLATRLGCAAAITWHGALDDTELRRRLADADLLAVPSFEGFGIVYLEAMAYGLPVVASTAGAAHEIVEPGVNGYLVRPGDRRSLACYLTELAQNRSQITAMGYQARTRYEQHPSWHKTMSGAISWLREVPQS